MGDIADMMLDGTLCEGCGVYLGSNNGFATRCAGCQEDDKEVLEFPNFLRPVTGKVSCPKCKRHVKEIGLVDHMRDKHSVAKQ